MCEITLLHSTNATILPHIWWKCMSMYIRPLTMFKRLLVVFWQSFMVDHYFCPVPACLFFSGVQVSPMAPKAMWSTCLDHIQLWVITVCKLPSGNHANQYRASNYWKYCLIIRSWAFSEGEVGNYSSVTRCYLKIPAPYSWEQQSYSGVTGHLLKAITSK